ncbi:MAG: hypothetical protein HYT80_06200 [Euryarchaeota archaeon]|nr:hypothetical protein [Euryarchaeota archaeon]
MGAAASALVTGLVGFDVDTTGTTVVARVASGGAIRTYDGGTLGTHLGEYLVPNCVRSDGVVAAESHVGFLDCAPNGGVDTYRIRYKDLTNAQFPATCLGCTQDFTGANDGGDPQASFGDMNEIGEISTYPLDGTNHERLFYVSQPFACGSPGPDQRCTVQRVAYTWSSVAQKRVGVHTYVFRQGDEDFLAEAYDTLSSPQQICNFYREGNWYVAGASGTGPATVWRVSFQQGRDDLTASLNKGLALPMSTSIACSTDKVAILDGTTLKVFDTFTGEVIPQLTRTVSAQSASRRLALSPDGKFGAIHDGSTIKIIDATTGSITGQVTTPAGSWRRMEFDATAQNLFTGTDTRIDRFKVVSLTTVTDKSTFVDPTELSPAAGGSITEVATQNPLAVGTGLISGMIPGAGNRWVEYVLGVLTAIGFAGIAWKATGGTVGRFGSRPGDSNVIGTAGFLGLCLSVPAYDFPLWIPLLTGVAGVALITRRFFR